MPQPWHEATVTERPEGTRFGEVDDDGVLLRVADEVGDHTVVAGGGGSGDADVAVDDETQRTAM